MNELEYIGLGTVEIAITDINGPFNSKDENGNISTYWRASIKEDNGSAANVYIHEEKTAQKLIMAKAVRDAILTEVLEGRKPSKVPSPAVLAATVSVYNGKKIIKLV